MTAEQATTFEHGPSIPNMLAVLDDLRTRHVCQGDCQPYRDVFTYNRWLAQGQQVQRGQHGARIPVIVHADQEDPEGNRQAFTMRRTSVVFCRCQVKPREVDA
jgi:hypothetical protein